MPTSDNRITLSLPQAGTINTYNALGGKTFVLGFDANQTEISRDNIDMVIAANSGGIIKLEGLYTPSATDTPNFEFQDGSTVSTFQFVETYSPGTWTPIMPLAEEETSTIRVSISEQGLSDDPNAPKPTTVPQKLPDGYSIDTAKDGWTADGETFVLEVAGSGKFTYNPSANTLTFTLDHAADHAGADVKEFEASITMKGPNGQDVKTTAIIEVQDAVAEGSLTVDNGNGKDYIHYQTHFTGDWNIDYGPEGQPAGDMTFVLHYQLTGFDPASTVVKVGEPTQLYLKDADGNNVLYGTIEFSAMFEGDTFGYYIFKPAIAPYNPSDPEKRPLAGLLNMRMEVADGDGASLSSFTANNTVWVQDFRFYPDGTAILTFDNDDSGPYADDPAGVILEKDLAKGPVEVEIKLPNNPAESSDKYFTVDTDLPSGWEDKGNGIWELDLPDRVGKLVLDKSSDDPADHILKYVLEEAMDHTNDQVFDLYDVIPVYLVKQGSESKYPIDVVVKIIDDEPTVALSCDDSKPYFSGDEIEGVFGLDYGADGAAKEKPLLVNYKDDNGTEINNIEVTLGQTVELKNGSEVIGHLTLNDDKTFVFKPVGGAGTATISVTAKDADGDKASDSVTITYGAKPGTIDFDNEGAFNEGYLPAGSLGDDPTQLTKTVNIDPDWKIDTSSDWVKGSGDTWTLDHNGGTFTYDAGKDTLTYTLKTAVDHDKASNDDSLDVDLPVTLVHKDTGSTADVSVHLTIDDDTPSAEYNYTPGSHFSGSDIDIPLTVEYGADGKADTEPFVITYEDANGKKVGPFELAEGGSKEIEIDGVKVGDLTLESGKLVFKPVEKTTGTAKITIEATDADGDKDSDTVTIKFIAKPGDVIDFDKEGAFNEGYLPNGSLGGDPAQLTKTVNIDSEWKIDTSSDWTKGSGETWTRDYNGGTFTYDADKDTLTFTLSNAVEHDKATNDDSLGMNMPVTLVHKTSNATYDTTVHLTIDDDAPITEFTYSPVVHYSDADISIPLTLKFGADGKATADSFVVTYEDASGTKVGPFEMTVGGSKEIEINGEKVGDLTFEDGKFVFKPVDKTTGTAKITVEATDADGDTATDSVTVNFIAKPPAIFDFDTEGAFNEGYLPEGSLGADPAQLTKTLDVDSNWKVDTTGWTQQGTSDVWTIAYEGGEFTYNATDSTLTYTLNSAVEHNKLSNDDNLAVDMPLTLVHKVTNTTFDTTAHVTIEDDAPVTDFTYTTSNHFSGTDIDIPLTLKFGADGEATANSFVVTYEDADGKKIGPFEMAVGGSKEIEIDGKKVGDLTFEDGKLVFKATAGTSGTAKITVEATDADGDKASDTVTVKYIATPSDIIDFDAEGAFNEGYLPEGSLGADPAQLTKTVNIDSEWKIDTSSDWTKGAGNTWTRDYNGGTFTYDEDKDTLTFTLNNAVDHDKLTNDVNLSVDMAVTLIHKDSGATSDTTVHLTIEDDTPVADFTYTPTNHFSGADIDVPLTIKFGADGKAGDKPFVVTFEDADGNKTAPFEMTVGGSKEIEINGEKVGNLTFENGKLVFKAVSKTSGTAKITVEATDSDGDKASDTAIIKYIATPDDIIDFDAKGAFNEGYLPEGSLGADPAQLTKTVDIDSEWKIDTSSDWTKGAGNTWTRDYNGGTFTYDEDKSTLTFTLNNALDHDKLTNDVSLSVDMPVTLIHTATNATSDTTVHLTVQDDTPVADFTYTPDMHFSGTDIDVPLTLKFGADGKAANKPFIVTYEDAEGHKAGPFEMTVGDSEVFELNGVMVGRITLQDGKLVFLPLPGTNGTAKITVEATDADGDKATDTVSVNFVSKPDDVIDFDAKGPFNEGYLPEGSIFDDPTQLTKTVSLDPAWKIDTSSGWTNGTGNTWTLDYNGGTFTYDGGKDTLTFTLKNAVDHDKPTNDTSLSVDMPVTLVHKTTGDTSNSTVHLTIQDDAPVVDFTYTQKPQFAGDDIDIPLSLKFGADGKAAADAFTITYEDAAGKKVGPFELAVGSSKAIEIDGVKVGDLSFVNGKFVFKPVANTSGTAKITVEATDADGDKSSDTVQIEYMSKPSDIIDFDAKGPFNEGYLPEGSLGSKPGELTKTVDIDSDWKVDTTGWTQSAPNVWTKSYSGGTFTYNGAKDSLTFTLDNAVTHAKPVNDDRLSVDMPITLVHKTTSSTVGTTVHLTIEDDTPHVDSAQHTLNTITHEVSGEIYIKAGADGSVKETDDTLTFSLKGVYKGPSGSVEIPAPAEISLSKTSGQVVEIDTLAGKLQLHYDAKSGTVKYTYQASQALKGYKEEFTFSQVDKDGDIASGALTFNFNDTIISDAGLVVDEAALPGLGSAQHYSDDYSDTYQLPVNLVLDQASQVSWNAPTGNYYADANGDGKYSLVQWHTVGNTLEGRVGNVVVISIDAKFENGQFTGEIESTLYKPFQHAQPPALPGHERQELNGLSITQKNGTEQATIPVKVTIVDDEPMRDYQDAIPIIDINKAGASAAESVYITLDVSGSISYSEGQSAVAAIKALAQAYIDNGINAVFSLTCFSSCAKTYYNHVTPQDIINNLDWCKICKGGGTNFEAGLKETMALMEAGRNSSQYGEWHQTLYFISDGAVNQGDRTVRNWVNYRNNHDDNLDVYAINVDKCLTQGKYQAMVNVAGDANDYYHVTSYSALLNQLVELVHTEAEGNILGNITGADKTWLESIEYGGKTYTLSDSGTDIDLGNGIKFTVYKNGDYTLKSGKLTSDVYKDLMVTIKDADGDSVRTEANLVIKSYHPQAFDNVGVAETYGAVDPLAQFGCNVNTSHLKHGCYNYTCFNGVVLPGIPEYSTDLYNCKGYAALYRANKCVDGAAALQNLVGGAAAVQQLFSDIGVSPQAYGSSSIISFNVENSGGTIAFNWAFKPGCNSTAWDAAFWVLKDASGKVVDAGLLHQSGNGKWASGVTYVDVPDQHQKYTLYIVQQEMGYNSYCPNSCLYLKDVVYFADSQLRAVGNVLTNPSPDGYVDSYEAYDRVYSITYINAAGHEITQVLVNGQATIQTAQGKLIIDDKGNYTFISNEGVTSDVAEDFTYTFKTPSGQTASAELHIRSEDHLINGTDRADVINNTGSKHGDLIQAGDGDDTIFGGNGDEIIYGGKGDDEIHAGGGNDVIHGGDGNDVLYGDAGNDRLYGGKGNDALYGGDGNDTLSGGSGINFLNGGNGADIFLFDKNSVGGIDIIADFNKTEGDRLRFEDVLDSRLESFTLDSSNRSISFEINWGNDALNKLVEIHFDSNDRTFSAMEFDYLNATSSAEQELILQAYVRDFMG